VEFFPRFAIEPSLLQDMEEMSAKLMERKALDKEITKELDRRMRLLTIEASGNKELFALKQLQFELEDRAGRQLEEGEIRKLKLFVAEEARLKKLIAANEETGQQITEIWEAVGRRTEDAIVNALTGASSAMEGFRDIALAILEDITREIVRTSLIQPIFSREGGFIAAATSFFGGFFAHGGSFTVPGSGGTDSSPVSFMATPGERVDVRTPGQVSNDGMGEGDVNNRISISNTVNITESGVSSNTSIQGAANDLSVKLGEQIKQAVTEFIINEQRPGGLLPARGA